MKDTPTPLYRIKLKGFWGLQKYREKKNEYQILSDKQIYSFFLQLFIALSITNILCYKQYSSLSNAPHSFIQIMMENISLKF